MADLITLSSFGRLSQHSLIIVGYFRFTSKLATGTCTLNITSFYIVFCVIETGLAFIIGTIIEFNIIQYLRHTGRRSTATTIQLDELVLFEHSVNIVNAPILFFNLLYLSIPAFNLQIFESVAFGSVWHIAFSFALFHRAIGGMGIAGLRVLCISFPYSVIRIGARRLVKCSFGLTLLLSFFFAIGNNFELTIYNPEMNLLSYSFKEATLIEPKAIYNFSGKEIFQKFCGVSCLVCNVAEFLCFVVIFVEMSKHHRRHVKLCLMNKPKLAKKEKETEYSYCHRTFCELEC